MKKNVFRNFDFVVCQTDKMKAIQKIVQSAYFFRFLLFIDSFLELFFKRDIDFWKKIIISQKWRWCPHWRSFRTSKFEPPDPCAHFIYTLQKVTSPRSTAPSKKPEFRSLFADLGHFLTSDVILKENFCRLASIWLIGLMKLFALGRIDLAVGRKLWLSWKGWKVHRKGGYPAAHFEFCRRSVTPSGPPSALTSSTGGVVAGHRFYTRKQNCVGGVVCVDVVFIISPRYWTFHHL